MWLLCRRVPSKVVRLRRTHMKIWVRIFIVAPATFISRSYDCNTSPAFALAPASTQQTAETEAHRGDPR
jgi:hypothetical protein